MITSVAMWRCQCGKSVKAVTEIDRARISEVERILADCPECGNQQALYAHRIVTVSCEKSDDSAAVSSRHEFTHRSSTTDSRSDQLT